MLHIDARITEVLTTPMRERFVTAPVPVLGVDLAGIPGDRHYGFARDAGAREPWYRRGTKIRSGRQLTIVAAEELEEIARRMGVARIAPGWIGANVVVRGVVNFSMLPWGSRIFAGDGAVLVNEGENMPCRYAGAEIARAYPEFSGLDTLFVKTAKHLRGVVASVERAGDIMAGPARIRVAPQNNWTGGRLL
jgi:hypothetical protein